MGGVLIFILLGMNPTSDVLAHLGGFLAGIVFGAILSFMSPGSPLAAKLDRGCAVSVVLLTLVVWALAFFRGGSPR
jgi:hypothetical protein